MSAVFYRSMDHEYPVAVRASGMHIYDRTGHEYLDMSGGAAVSCVGHQHPEIVAAINEQIGTLAYAHTAFFSNRPQEELAAMLADRFAEPDARVYFTSGGSEANETAIKMAYQYWRAKGHNNKTTIIGREHSYHGNTIGALSISGNLARRKPVTGLLHNWPRIEPNYARYYRRENESEADYSVRSASLLEDAIQAIGPDNVAAFIAEPVVGATLGAVPASAGYFKEIRKICDRHEVLLILDEVMCGTGRTGRFFAHEFDGVVPDIVTLAKGLSGGYMPLSATLVRRCIADAFEQGQARFSHGHTHVGHAAACAAGLSVLEVLGRYQLIGSVEDKGRCLDDALRQHFGDDARVVDFRGRGLLRAIELDPEALRAGVTGHSPPVSIVERLRNAAMRQGLICYPGMARIHDKDRYHILLAPPFIVENRHFDEAADKLRGVLNEVCGG
jgi:adenosylmethionine-8-amino-7-oxononanoate aminotransferase